MSSRLLSVAFMQTALFNALGLPATAVPVWLSEAQRLPLALQIVSPFAHDARSLAVAAAMAERLPGMCYARLPSSYEVADDRK
jgi:Asp-tRNA(Asn)/Glu-tRNA(Gln) amidotransferase A subunit family amidase